jgi:serine/threonine protein kinase
MGPMAGYRLKQLIGVGSFAEVWGAERVNLQGIPCASDVALKIGCCHYDEDKSQREMWMVLSTAPFEFEGFNRVLDVTSYHNRLVISLELAEDNLLGMASKGLSVHECARYIGEAAVALDSLHARDFGGKRMIHGSINPTDILIQDGRAKVADLGPFPIGPVTSIPFYKAICMPPEFQGLPVPQLLPQSDQYGLAATYAWVRLGDCALSAPRRGELVGTIEVAQLPEREKEVLLKALSSKPQDRFSSCSDFAKNLEKVLLNP